MMGIGQENSVKSLLISLYQKEEEKKLCYLVFKISGLNHIRGSRIHFEGTGGHCSSSPLPYFLPLFTSFPNFKDKWFSQFVFVLL